MRGGGDRVRTAAWFGLPVLLTGGYWYLRNLVAVGNPIPFTSWGPLDLPTPERAFELRPGFSVSHYFTDTEVWTDWFFPGLEESFGFLWPLTVAAIAVGGVYMVWRGAEPMLRMLGGVVLFTAVAYLFTPLTAAGEEGMPIAFEWNVRYIAPAAAVGLAALPCLPALRAPPERRVATLAGLSILLAATVGSLVQWEQGHVKGAVAAGVGVLAGFAAIAWLRSRGRLGPGAPRRWALGLAGQPRSARSPPAGGCRTTTSSAATRTSARSSSSPRRFASGATCATHELRSSGVRGVFNQYPFYGDDLSNEVQWLGVEGDDGAWLRIPTCELWREELAAGDYTHVVTMYDPFNPGRLTDTKEALWTREDPASRELFRDGPVSVFELTGEPDPAACGDLPELSEAELNGDSVNLDPTANQP